MLSVPGTCDVLNLGRGRLLAFGCLCGVLVLPPCFNCQFLFPSCFLGKSSTNDVMCSGDVVPGFEIFAGDGCVLSHVNRPLTLGMQPRPALPTILDPRMGPQLVVNLLEVASASLNEDETACAECFLVIQACLRYNSAAQASFDLASARDLFERGLSEVPPASERKLCGLTR